MAFIGRVLIENISAGFCSICELALNFYLHRTEYASQKMIKGKKERKKNWIFPIHLVLSQNCKSYSYPCILQQSTKEAVLLLS
jgi:hypothetical protein